jgi:uncharacterized membrane protein
VPSIDLKQAVRNTRTYRNVKTGISSIIFIILGIILIALGALVLIVDLKVGAIMVAIGGILLLFGWLGIRSAKRRLIG